MTAHQADICLERLDLMERKLLIGGRSISYELIRKNVKNVNITVRHDGTVRVSAPKGVPEKDIRDILYQKEDFLIKNIERCKTRTFPEEIFYFGKSLPVIYGKGNRICDGYAIIADKEHFGECLKVLYKQAAMENFPQIYECAYKRFRGIEKPGLRFRSMKTRWGSYSRVSGMVTLNTALAAAPPICIEAVAAHELAHVYVMNHSKDFYRVLLSAMPEYRSCHELLKQFSASIYAQI